MASASLRVRAPNAVGHIETPRGGSRFRGREGTMLIALRHRFSGTAGHRLVVC
jgi:hypothetical protein